jgi:hypothetical protein
LTENLPAEWKLKFKLPDYWENLKNQKLDDEYGISWWMDSDTLKQHLI